MKCRYCGYRDGHHDPLCPKPGSPEMEIWERGYKDGRQGKSGELGWAFNLLYTMGWKEGNIALEEAANGFDPRFDSA